MMTTMTTPQPPTTTTTSMAMSTTTTAKVTEEPRTTTTAKVTETPSNAHCLMHHITRSHGQSSLPAPREQTRAQARVSVAVLP